MKLLTMMVTVMLAICLSSSVSAQYYYSRGVQNNLQIDSLKVAIKFDNSASKANLIASIGRIVEEIEERYIPDSFAVCSLSTASGYDSFLDSLDTLSGVYLVEPYYLAPSVVGQESPTPDTDTFRQEWDTPVLPADAGWQSPVGRVLSEVKNPTHENSQRGQPRGVCRPHQFNNSALHRSSRAMRTN